MDRQSVKTLKTRKINLLFSNQYYKLLVLVTVLLTGAHANSSDGLTFPPSHQSSYSIEKYGTHVGDMHNELSSQNNQLTYISQTKAAGFASLFVKNDFIETSILNWFQNGETRRLQQQSYQLFRGKRHKKNQSISFDWSDAAAIKITGNYKNSTYEISSEKTVWGRHLIPLIMSKELLTNNNISGHTFHITDKGGLQNYTYALEHHETMEFSGKTYPVLKFSIKRKNSNRMSYIWLSGAHHYLPLKIEQYKDGDLNVSMLMTRFITAEKAEQVIHEEEVEYDD